MAVRWAADNAAANGADANRIYLMGHSAGATHVATYVGHPEFHAPKALAGAMFSSAASYDLTKVENESEGRSAYYGSDHSLYAQRSALPGLIKSTTPFMANAAELDPPQMVEQLELLKSAMCASARGCVRTLLQPKHNHMSQSYAINTPDTLLTDQILAFIKSGK